MPTPLTFLLVSLFLMSASAQAANFRSFEAVSLQLGNDNVLSPLLSAEGGSAAADVVQEKSGPDHIVRKHLAGVKYEDIAFEIGLGASPGMYDWLKQNLENKHERKSGEILAADYNKRTMTRISFSGGILSEIGLPALDASSKDAAKLTIKVKPEYTRAVTEPMRRVPFPKPTNSRDWLISNFRLKIDGLEDVTDKVEKIDALVMKQKIVEHAVGELGNREPEPASMEIPNLVISLPESASKALRDWHEDFVIKGNNSQDKEKSGSLEFLASDRQTVLFTLKLGHLGIFKLTPDKMESGMEGIRRIKAEMYCEEMSFDFNPNAVAKSTVPGKSPARGLASQKK